MQKPVTDRMKPVAIFRYSATEGPGYFAIYLDARGIPWREIKVDRGEPVPSDPRDFSGMALMGGPMSTNDALAWIPGMLELIRLAVSMNVPVLGHCLGGQLMARAMGGVVTGNHVKEIGWGRVVVAENKEAKTWFGQMRQFESFHWHGETFSIPRGAQNIASSEYCANQAFSLGRHLAMQCHVEMTPSLVRAWCGEWQSEVASLSARTKSVQSPAEILRDLDERVEKLNGVARGLYERWLSGLHRSS